MTIFTSEQERVHFDVFVEQNIQYRFNMEQLSRSVQKDSYLYAEIDNLAEKPDYLSSLQAHGWDYEEGVLVNRNDSVYYDGIYLLDIDVDNLDVLYEQGDIQTEKALCELIDIGLEYFPVLEYYIVSLWLGKELKKQGEVVDFDFLGLVVWGRSTTSSSVKDDEVIMRIYDKYRLK